MTRSRSRASAWALAVVVFVFPLAARAAQDVLTVGTVTASGTTVSVPVSIRDVAGTPLGMDRPAGSKIQAFSIRVTYAPASAVQSVAFSRDGITKNLDPVFETKPVASGSASLVVSFDESSSPIPFSLNAAAPGNLVASLVFTLSASAAPSSSVALTLDPALTQLTDSGGSSATKETVANGTLALVDGQIDIPALKLSLSPASKTITAGGSATFSALLNGAAPGDLAVALESSNPSVATVPASVVIAAGSSSATFKVTAAAPGTAKITATSDSRTASANITVSTEPAECTRPASPVLAAPASAQSGTPYSVSWSAVDGATEYALEESADETFATSTVQTSTTPGASFTHADAGGRRFYRVRARNHAGSCDVYSAFSNVVSVLITEPPASATRVFAVVGSLPGNFGSYFRTSLQLYNPYAAAVSGRIVFHPAGTPGSDDDPSLAYSVLPGRTLSFADLVPAMGVASGIGSADLVGDPTSPLPVAAARLFNDGAAAGTTGLGQEALAFDRALQTGNTGVLFAPEDLQHFRLNIGVRTLGEGVAMSIAVRDREGVIVKSLTREYAPHFFTQISSAAMLDGYALAGGETISFTLTAGSAFVYGATTDNTTNDPSVAFASRVD